MILEEPHKHIHAHCEKDFWVLDTSSKQQFFKELDNSFPLFGRIKPKSIAGLDSKLLTNAFLFCGLFASYVFSVFLHCILPAFSTLG